METKDVDPNYSTKRGVTQLLYEYALTADLPDVSLVLHSRWEDFFNASFGGSVVPMVRIPWTLHHLQQRLCVLRRAAHIVLITVRASQRSYRRCGRRSSSCGCYQRIASRFSWTPGRG